MFFDSHAHLDDKRFDEDRQELIAGLRHKNVSYVINVGADLESSQDSIELADKYDFIFASVGVHPHYAETLKSDYLDRIVEMAKHPKVVAIGEIGLDYHYNFSDREIQKKRMIEQLELCQQLDLPVIIHNREAYGDIYQILKDNKHLYKTGVIHCYSGSWEMAQRYMDLGFHIAIGGTVTFKNAKHPVEVATNIDLDRLLIETDCPYLAPHPERGKRNDPSLLCHIAGKIAQLRGMTVDEVADATHKNAEDLFLKDKV